MATTLLIKALDLTKGTPLGGNIDVNKYLSTIKDTQIFVIEPILGTKLYNKVLADYESASLTGDYFKLVENYVQPILIYSTAAEFLLTHAYAVTNGGIFKHLPENSESVSKSEVDFMVQNQRTKANTYIQRLEVFLCDTNLPEYNNAQDNEYDINPDPTATYTGGWFLE